jgi:hypothetical protein
MDDILLVLPVPPALNLNGRDITSTLPRTELRRSSKLIVPPSLNAKSWHQNLPRAHLGTLLPPADESPFELDFLVIRMRSREV